MRFLSSSLLLTTFFAFPLLLIGDEYHEHAQTSLPEDQIIYATGIVKSIAENHESLRIFHDPIPALKWPAMNMPFKVADDKLTHPLDVGDKVNFEFIQKEGKSIIVRMKKQ